MNWPVVPVAEWLWVKQLYHIFTVHVYDSSAHSQ